MEVFSMKLDPSTYDTQGLCDGIDVRQTLHTDLELLGALRAHQDWSKYVAPTKHYMGTLGPRFSLLGVLLPNCIPERLEILSYAAEFSILHDDVTDMAADKKIVRSFGQHWESASNAWAQRGHEDGQLLKSYNEIAENDGVAGDTVDREAFQAGGKKKMHAEIVKRMIRIDPEATKATISAWSQFLSSSARERRRFQTLEDYLPYRVADVGQMLWLGYATFGLGLKIPESEMDILRRMTRPAWIATGLTNDIFSWEMEAKQASEIGQDHVVNAIWILAHEHRISVEDAKLKCREVIKEHVAQFLENVRIAREDNAISEDARAYMDSMQYNISGNAIWSMTCPRYNAHVTLNERQVQLMDQDLRVLEQACHHHLASGARHDSAFSSATDLQATTSESNSHSRTDKASSGISTCSTHTSESSDFEMGSEIASAPVEYLCKLPSKGVRSILIDALNHWLRVPPQVVEQVKTAIDLLHTSSLILDDFQDGSALRRGMPAAHLVFGSAQAINSSSYSITKALQLIHEALGPDSVRCSLERLNTLFVGQAYDLHFTRTRHCPSFEEYMRMVDQSKQSSLYIRLFLLTSDLVQAAATKNATVNLKDLCLLLGRYFQIRDDYQNLISADYSKQKGFCEDLDEGKYSLPMVHLYHSQPHEFFVRNIFSPTTNRPGLMREHKMIILDVLKKAGSLKFTSRVLKRLASEIDGEIKALEQLCGGENPFLQALWANIKV